MSPSKKVIKLDGHVQCPVCGNYTLPDLKKYPVADAARCQHCNEIIKRKQ